MARSADTIGVLPAAMACEAMDLRLICPKACGPEAAWAGKGALPARDLLELINHFTGRSVIEPAEAGKLSDLPPGPDLKM